MQGSGLPLRLIPSLRLLLPVALGIFLAQHFSFRFEFLFFCFVTGLALLFFNKLRIAYKYRIWNGILLHLFMVFCGFTFYHLQNPLLDPFHFYHRIQPTKQYVQGIIVQTKNKSNYTECLIEINSLSVHDQPTPCRGKLLTQVPLNIFPEPGDTIQFYSKISKNTSNQNPVSFDYAHYLIRKSIFATCKIWPTDPFTLHKYTHGSKNLVILANRFQKKLIQSLKTYIPNQNNFSIAAGIILGYTDEINHDTKKLFSQTGTTHLLAVSGMHVGLINEVLVLLLGGLLFNSYRFRWIKFVIITLCIWSFVFITGMSSSALRAASMFTAYNFGRCLSTDIHIFNVIGFSTLFLLIIDPNILFDAGFQLSIGAIIGIIYFHDKIMNFVSVNNKFLHKIIEWNVLSISAVLGVLPLVLYYFGNFPVYFILPNLLAIPLNAIITYTGCLIFIFQPISDKLSIGLGQIVNFSTEILNTIIQFTNALPYSCISHIEFGLQNVVGLYLLGILSAVGFQLKSKKLLFISAFLILGLSIFHLIEVMHQPKQPAYIVYQHPKKLISEVIYENYAILLNGYPITNFEETFLLSGNHMEYNVKKVICLDTTQSIKLGKLNYQNDTLTTPTFRIYTQPTWNQIHISKPDSQYCIINYHKILPPHTMFHASCKLVNSAIEPGFILK